MAKSQSQWVNPIFPVQNKANPSSHFTPSRPSFNCVISTTPAKSANPGTVCRSQHLCHYSGYQSHASSKDFFSSISKTMFCWTSIKGIHDNNDERSFRKHYFKVNSQSIRVALSSSLDSLINRDLEDRHEIVWSAFSFVSLTGNVLKLQIYKQCTTTAT